MLSNDFPKIVSLLLTAVSTNGLIPSFQEIILDKCHLDLDTFGISVVWMFDTILINDGDSVNDIDPSITGDL